MQMYLKENCKTIGGQKKRKNGRICPVPVYIPCRSKMKKKEVKKKWKKINWKMLTGESNES